MWDDINPLMMDGKKPGQVYLVISTLKCKNNMWHTRLVIFQSINTFWKYSGEGRCEYSCWKRNPLYPIRAASFVSMILHFCISFTWIKYDGRTESLQDDLNYLWMWERKPLRWPKETSTGVFSNKHS